MSVVLAVIYVPSVMYSALVCIQVCKVKEIRKQYGMISLSFSVRCLILTNWHITILMLINY